MSDYITSVLVNSQVIISEVLNETAEHFVFLYPTKPIMLPDSNKILLVAMNPFSDEIEYTIDKIHIISIGKLQDSYVDIYKKSVEVIKNNNKVAYGEIDEILDEYENSLNKTEISHLIH